MGVVYYLSGLLATAAFVGVFAGLIRPSLFRKFAGQHATRVNLSLLFLGLVIAFGGVTAATEPGSVKQARLQKEHQAQVTQAEAHAQKLAATRQVTEDKLAAETQAEAAKLVAEAKALQELPVPPTPAPVPAPTPAPKVAPAPAPTPKTTLSCDPNYTPCIRNVPGNTLNCPDVGVMVQVVGTDHHKFDANGDGYGCESYGNR